MSLEFVLPGPPLIARRVRTVDAGSRRAASAVQRAPMRAVQTERGGELGTLTDCTSRHIIVSGYSCRAFYQGNVARQCPVSLSLLSLLLLSEHTAQRHSASHVNAS